MISYIITYILVLVLEYIIYYIEQNLEGTKGTLASLALYVERIQPAKNNY
jgi:hypothetical protein